MRSHRKWLSGWTTALVLLFSVVELATDAFAQYYGKLVRNITALHQREDGNGDFLIGHCNGNCEPDLYFIKRRNTDTKSIEVHCLDGASNFQKFIVHTGTPLAQREDGNGDFRMCMSSRGTFYPAVLFFIKRRNTDTKSIEVHSLFGPDFQKFRVQTGTQIPQSEDGNGDFQMGLYDGPANVFFIKRRNTDSKMIEVHILRSSWTK